MSQSKIAMKKDSMRKNKKLVINIAMNKEALASTTRLEADHELGSLKEEKEKERIVSSEKRTGYGSVEVIDDGDGSVREGVMREVELGTGLSGALNRLREQGSFKKERKVVGVKENCEVDRFRDGFKDIQIERRDEWGRVLNEKEAYRALSHAFHGKKPGKKKLEKRKKKQEDKSKEMDYSDKAVERMRQVQANLKTPYIVL